MLTKFALNNRTLVLAIVVMSIVMGLLSFSTHPSREDPAIIIRNAAVIAQYQGMSAKRIEQLITVKLEEKIREIPEVDKIMSTSSMGQSLINIVLKDEYTDVAPVWANLRNKMDDIKPELPEGTIGPMVSDDKGNVAMATIAMTAEGFSNAEMFEAAKEIRRSIYAKVPGVRKVEFFGVEEQRIFVEFDSIRVAQLGYDPQLIMAAIKKQNVVLPGGRIEADGGTISIEPTGDFSKLDELNNLSIVVPGRNEVLYLRDFATIKTGYAEPPQNPAYYNGEPALVVSVSMVDNFNSFEFGESLKALVEQARIQLPIGFELSFITYQPTEIESAVYGVLNNLWQTILIVLLVVILFLGLRTGLIVGSMVPLVMLMTILIMRMIDIELERMSLASLIIALGLLIDNGIVVAEELLGKIKRGQDRIQAAKEVGKTMSGPLLSASLTTIFAFLPLMLAPGGAGEYTRSISLVIAIALLVSWVVALTALILFCVWFLKAPKDSLDEQTAYDRWYYRAYRSLLRTLVKFRWLTVPLAFSTLFLGVWLFQFVNNAFFPNSERTQLQIIVELPIGANTYATQDVVKRLTDWIKDEQENPEVTNVVAYIAGGGPRFYLSLEPMDGTSNSAYLLANVKNSKDVAVLQAKVKNFALNNLPEARVTPKAMSMGPSEAGLVEYRIYGPDENQLKEYAAQIIQAMRDTPGSRNIKDSWDNPVVTVKVIIDQEAARRAGISSEDIANALDNQLVGVAVTDYRVGDLSIPVVLRSQGDQRTNLDRLRTINVSVAGNYPVPLLQVASFDGEVVYSQIKRENLERVVTVSGANNVLSASAFDKKLSGVVNKLIESFPAAYRIEKGGELEGSADAQAALGKNVPLAFVLMLLVLIWQFDSIKKTIMVLLTIPLVLTGVAGALIIMPGANFSFMGTLGFLALAGIVINNAIVLIDRIEIERERGKKIVDAVIEAGVKRLQPIIMTTCTTIFGLMPIILSKDVLFYDLAVVMGGGLLIGTLLSLIVTPCLYAIFFREKKPMSA